MQFHAWTQTLKLDMPWTATAATWSPSIPQPKLKTLQNKMPTATSHTDKEKSPQTHKTIQLST